MADLKIDKFLSDFNKEASEQDVEKTAEELVIEKIAMEQGVLDQAKTLSLIGENLTKFASENDIEVLSALGEDLQETGARMGAALTKTASDSGQALIEGIEIAGTLHKLASVMAEIADQVQDENFSADTEAVIKIANELVEEANEVLEAAAEGEAEGEATVETTEETEAGEGTEKEAGVKEIAGKVGGAFKGSDVAEYMKKVTRAMGDKAPKTFAEKAKFLLTHEKGRKALAPAIAAYGGAAAAVGAGAAAAKKK